MAPLRSKAGGGKPQRQTAASIRPYLASSEVMQISGITRRVLGRYIEKGIVRPLQTEEDEWYNRYTLDQAVQLELVQALRQEGASIEEVAALVSRGGMALIDAAYLSTAEAIRRNRRMLKSIVHRRNQIEGFRPVGIQQDYYLRYLPQRWCAIIPSTVGEEDLMDLDLLTDQMIALRGVIATVGWSPTFASGTITSIAGDEKGATGYVFEELASPPMPLVTGGMVVDGGCYRVIDQRMCPQCEGLPCQECARFGREPTRAERLLWKRTASRVIDRTLLVDDLVAPYETGPWAPYTQQVLAAREGKEAAAAEQRRERHRPPALPLAPQLMPQETLLPMGVTACLLPAGFYLCHQNDYDDRDRAMQRMLGALAVMPHRHFDRAQEGKMAEERREEMGGPHGPRGPHAREGEAGPFVEPFAMPRNQGDPRWRRFVRPLKNRELSDVTLLTGMGLPPEDGFLMVHTDLPTEPAPGHGPTASRYGSIEDLKGLRQELQVLVDPVNLGVVPPEQPKDAPRSWGEA